MIGRRKTERDGQTYVGVYDRYDRMPRMCCFCLLWPFDQQRAVIETGGEGVSALLLILDWIVARQGYLRFPWDYLDRA